LADPIIRSRVSVLDVVNYDWMHAALQDGTLTTEAALFLSACEEVGVASEHIGTFLKNGWSFPKASRSKGKALHRVFDSHRKSTSSKLKASASEMLGLYALLRHYFEIHVGDKPQVAAQLASFQAACACVDVILRAKRGLLTMGRASGELRGHLDKHFRLHEVAYGSSHFKPKHHWMWDVCDQFDRSPFVLDCFVIERLHLRAKAMANSVLNTAVFERSVLSSMLNTHRTALLAMDSDQSGLSGRTSILPECPSARIASSLVQGGLQISVGDFAFHGDSMGSVVACCLEFGCLYVIVDKFEFLRRLSAHSGVWRRGAAREVWHVAAVELALCWSAEGSDFVVLRLR
jgi:hypothetical protein